jgi:hypothetical protein
MGRVMAVVLLVFVACVRATPKASFEDEESTVDHRPPPPPDPDKLEDWEILEVMRAHKGEIEECRARYPRSSECGVVLTVALRIVKTGTVSDIRVTPERFAGEEIGRCLVASVEKWRFRAFATGSMPLDFPVTLRKCP